MRVSNSDQPGWAPLIKLQLGQSGGGDLGAQGRDFMFIVVAGLSLVLVTYVFWRLLETRYFPPMALGYVIYLIGRGSICILIPTFLTSPNRKEALTYACILFMSTLISSWAWLFVSVEDVAEDISLSIAGLVGVLTVRGGTKRFLRGSFLSYLASRGALFPLLFLDPDWEFLVFSYLSSIPLESLGLFTGLIVGAILRAGGLNAFLSMCALSKPETSSSSAVGGGTDYGTEIYDLSEGVSLGKGGSPPAPGSQLALRPFDLLITSARVVKADDLGLSGGGSLAFVPLADGGWAVEAKGVDADLNGVDLREGERVRLRTGDLLRAWGESIRIEIRAE